eukprot:Skav218388  [mRNA]  locus=scaffold3482:8652:12922:- [translate_table: standard]
MPLWRTCFFPLAVLFEAWGRSTGLPTIFYLDAFYTLLSSLLHKSITYQVANFHCRARYWAVGTAAPGSGKSPALEPLKRALLEVLRESPDLAPGKNMDGFHVQPIGTHLAAVDRLRHTTGYQYFGASEGGPILCSPPPGDSVQWETAVDRSKRRAAPEEVKEDPAETNVSVMIMQQVSLFSGWWAQAEDKMSIGLAGRFVFAFAAAGEPGPPKLADFGNEVVIPLIKNIFRFVLRTVGPHAPLPTDSPLLRWFCCSSSQQEVHRYRLICHSFTKTLPMDETFATCLNKNGYWLSVISFWNSLLQQSWPAVLQGDRSCQLLPRISDEALRASMEFFTFRFLFGASVLCADMRRRSWVKPKRHQIVPQDSRWHVGAALLLKASCGATITAEMAARASPMFRRILDLQHKNQKAALEQYIEAISYLDERGFGTLHRPDNTQCPIFIKWPYTTLPRSCKEHLQEIHIHPMTFAGFCAPVEAEVSEETAVEGRHVVIQRSKLQSTNASQQPPKQRPTLTEQHLPKQPQFEGVSPMQETDKPYSEKPPDTEKEAEFRLLGRFRILGPREYSNVREQVEEFLGQRRDQGIYFFHNQVRKGNMVLYAHCKKDACKACSFRVKAVFALGEDEVEVSVKGAHGKLAAPQGGALWTVAEKYIINEHCSDPKKLSSKAVRDALKAAKMRLRCTAVQLNNFVNRTRGAANATKPPKKAKVSVAELASAAQRCQMKPSECWEDMPLSKLVVLPDMLVSEEAVCILWTCKGMLRRAKGARRKVVKLVVDGKQKILSNEYTVVTVGFVVGSKTLSRSKIAGRKSSQQHTSTQEPFLQALVDSESAANMKRIFEAACSLATEHARVDLRKQVWQLHKDFALGIEKARMEAFPKSRPTLKEAEARLQDADAEAAVLTARPRQRAPKKIAPKVHKGPFETLNKIISLSRQLPTVQLLDGIWGATFEWLSRINKAAVTYLQKHYFKAVSVEGLSKRFRCREAMRGETLWFGTFWSGIVGTYPGSASGTQTIEGFHSSWQTKLKQNVRVSPIEFFNHMQEMFEEWCSEFCWDEARLFHTWPPEPAQELLNGQALRSVGRSPAVDFWLNRETKISGARNYWKTYRRTSGTDQDAGVGITTFWVLHARKKCGLAPAALPVKPEDAKVVTELICSEGKTLEALLRKCGVITVQERGAAVDAGKLQELFGDLAVVMQGDLPNSAWPHTDEELDLGPTALFCTCLPFLLHAECEHVLYVKALEGIDGVSLKGIRAVQRRGRKRKRQQIEDDEG